MGPAVTDFRESTSGNAQRSTVRRIVASAADWQASSVQVAGLLKQVKARGLDAKVLARCTPATRLVFENPYSARWHSGEALVDFSEATVAVAGPAEFEALNFDMAHASFGPILKPMVQVALAITGRSPATVLGRMPASIEQALRNVKCVWTSSDKNGGTLSFTYPCPIQPDTEHAWRGALRFVAELSGQPVRVDTCELRDGNSLHFKVSW